MATEHVASLAMVEDNALSNIISADFIVPDGLTSSILLFGVNFFNPLTGLDPGDCHALTYNGIEMTHLIDGQEFEEAYRLAHTIKGAAGSLEANALFVAARNLEHALRPMDLGSLQMTFEAALSEALAAVATLKENTSHAD